MTVWIRRALGACVLLGALGAGVATHLTAATPATPPAARLAAFLSTPLADIDGRTHTLDSWKGKVRVINFWATWCPPCREEMPLFMQAQKTWGPRGVQFIGVAIDNKAAVAAFARELKINYPLLLAEEQGLSLMANQGNEVGALPFTVVIDAQGRVTQRFAGEVNAKLLDNWLKAAVAAR